MNNSTRRYPRTMQEAFGPYTSHSLIEMPSKPDLRGIGIFAIVALVTILFIACKYI